MESDFLDVLLFFEVSAPRVFSSLLLNLQTTMAASIPPTPLFHYFLLKSNLSPTSSSLKPQSLSAIFGSVANSAAGASWQSAKYPPGTSTVHFHQHNNANSHKKMNVPFSFGSNAATIAVAAP
jgi:hypothetical protein